jgi:predicted PurR-regulated permease PerM
MALLALIPAVGPALIWIPAGIILILLGSIWQGILVLVGGILIVSTIDNLLRPLLVSRDIRLPDALILLSILGGLSAFGIAGIIIGPVIAALFLAMWEMFAQEFEADLEKRG